MSTYHYNLGRREALPVCMADLKGLAELKLESLFQTRRNWFEDVCIVRAELALGVSSNQPSQERAGTLTLKFAHRPSIHSGKKIANV